MTRGTHAGRWIWPDYPAVKTAVRLLIFRTYAEELKTLDGRHLAIGLLSTWVVGIGRWWEDPRASLLQHLGIGSIIYVLALSLFLWLVLWPVNPKNWSYFNVLTFVSLTSPPAMLYAIPVRHGLDLRTAQDVRLWLLAIVATWRILLLGFYLRRGAGLHGPRQVVALLFPLGLILFALTALNLEKVVFSFMGIIGQEARSVNDAAYGVLFFLSMLCTVMILPLFVGYVVISVRALRLKYGQSKETRVENKEED
jgi:hypothetical protein